MIDWGFIDYLASVCNTLNCPAIKMGGVANHFTTPVGVGCVKNLIPRVAPQRGTTLGFGAQSRWDWNLCHRIRNANGIYDHGSVICNTQPAEEGRSPVTI
jgi:hypothetical protein